jgi:hypothetical protein
VLLLGVQTRRIQTLGDSEINTDELHTYI